MPLSPFQKRVLTVVSRQRTPQSYVAGGSPFTAESPRISNDIDVFNDRSDLVGPAAEADAKALESEGLSVVWTRQLPGIWTGKVEGGPEALRLEWAHDSAFRFFPARRDEQFGYVLHPADLMTNKVLAAAGRSAARDLVDLVSLADQVPIGAAIIAAVGKDPGMPPETVIENMARFSRHQQSTFDALRSTEKIDGAQVLRAIKDTLVKTQSTVERLPAAAFGKLYFEGNRIVTPDPKKLAAYKVRTARRGGIAAQLQGAPVREIAQRYGGYEP